MRSVASFSLVAVSLSAAAQAEMVTIANQRGEKVKFCTYRSDDKSLVRPRQCWMVRPGQTIQWRRGEDDYAYDVRLFEPGAFELPICMKRNIRDSYRVEIAPRATRACVTALDRQSVAVRPWQPFDRVLLNWSADRFWYPATIIRTGTNGYRLRLDDGRIAESPARYISPLVVAAGARVEVNWKRQGRWYPGYVTDADADSVTVAFDDGFRETSPLARVRTELLP